MFIGLRIKLAMNGNCVRWVYDPKVASCGIIVSKVVMVARVVCGCPRLWVAMNFDMLASMWLMVEISMPRVSGIVVDGDGGSGRHPTAGPVQQCSGTHARSGARGPVLAMIHRVLNTCVVSCQLVWCAGKPLAWARIIRALMVAARSMA